MELATSGFSFRALAARTERTSFLYAGLLNTCHNWTLGMFKASGVIKSGSTGLQGDSSSVILREGINCVSYHRLLSCD